MTGSLPLLLLASEGAAEGNLSIFSPNLGLTFWTWVIFIALLVVLSKFAFPAILKMTEERERAIADNIAAAQQASAEAKAAAAEQTKLLAEARTQAAAVLSEARALADKARSEAVEKAKAEQEELVARARREIAAERERAVQELRAEAVELSIAMASKLVGQRLDTDADKAIVQSYLASLGAK